MTSEQNIGPALETFQRTEITEHHIYKRLARVVKSPENAKILQQIAAEPATPSNIRAMGVPSMARAARLFFTTRMWMFLARRSFRSR